MASRSEVLAAVKGQRVRVPDLQDLLQEWPQHTSPYLEQLRIDVDAKLEELIPAGKRLEQMKKGNVALFTATWWSQAEYERLKYIAYLSIWLFNWDDETDSNEFSNMADHFDAEQRFRQDTLDFIRQCLIQAPMEDDEASKPKMRLTESAQTGEKLPGSADSRLPSSSSAAGDVSSNSSSPSVGTSTEAPSPRTSATESLDTSPSTHGLERSTSSRKVTSGHVQHIRGPSSSHHPANTIANNVQKTRSRPEAGTGTQPAAKRIDPGPERKFRRNSLSRFASTIAKYFRPRRDSALDMECSAPIIEEIVEEVATTSLSRTPLILSFKTITEGICPHFSPHEHQFFLQECERFVNATEREQKLRVKGVLPSQEEYIAMRMDTGAVSLCVSVHEYALGIQLPDSIRTDPDMAEIWLQTSMIICIINDMLSLKKEIAQGETDSLIPILVGQGMGLQTAMDHAFGMTQSAKWTLDAAAVRLSEKVSLSHSGRICDDVKRFVDSCRIACTGSTHWSIVGGRYKIGVASLAGGLELHLE